MEEMTYSAHRPLIRPGSTAIAPILKNLLMPDHNFNDEGTTQQLAEGPNPGWQA
ncbi:MAG: hypothetical protein H6Q26_2670 [Bacteroidetes bacterium]|nr:hypothetical protein [Bacteroidota bacterium]